MTRKARQVPCWYCGKSMDAHLSYQRLAIVKTDGPHGFGQTVAEFCFEHRDVLDGFGSVTLRYRPKVA